MTSTSLELATAAMRSFLEMVQEFGPLLGDPDACDFLAGNPEEPALPGYVETIQKWAVPEHRRWFAYGFADPRAQEAAAAALTDELGLVFDADDILLTRGAHGRSRWRSGWPSSRGQVRRSSSSARPGSSTSR
jgi:aspartate aminotransferase